MDIIQTAAWLVNAGVLVAIYLYVQSREDRLRTMITEKHDVQDIQIRNAEKKSYEIVRNYETRFGETNMAIQKGKTETLDAMRTIGDEMRRAHESLVGEVRSLALKLDLTRVEK